MDLSQVKTLVQELQSADNARDAKFRQYRDMWHCNWELPPQLLAVEGIHKVVNTDPHDAIATATRVLTGKPLRLTMTPLASDPANKETANHIERNLLLQLEYANRRRPNQVQADMLQSALTYACIAAQVIDTEWQVKQLEDLKQDATRWKMIRDFSRFVIITYNPLDVHVAFSVYMPEMVAVCQKRTPRQLSLEYPGNKRLTELAKNREGNSLDYVEFWDYKTRCVYVNNGEEDLVLMEPKAHELPFLPWVANMGGSTLESEPAHAYHGLLYSVAQAGQWDTLNSLDTMRTSEIIWNWASPKTAEEGPMQDSSTNTESWKPGTVLKVTPGNTLRPLPPNQLDPGVTNIVDTLTGRIQKSTVSNILQGGGEGLANTAFASLNLMTLTAVGSLKPWREMTERALAEMFLQMVKWAEYTKIDLVAIESNKKDKGKTYVIETKSPIDHPELGAAIDASKICLKVELVPDLPTNRQSQVMTAIQLHQAGIMDLERILEELGVDDPQEILDNLALEQLEQNKVAELIQQLQDQMQQFQDMQAQFAQAQQQMAGTPMQAANEGGMPAAMQNPNATREMVNQEDRSGNPLAQEQVMP
jgi:hypothetical protein